MLFPLHFQFFGITSPLAATRVHALSLCVMFTKRPYKCNCPVFTAEVPTPVHNWCGLNWVIFKKTQKCYKVSDSLESWRDASRQCQSEGAQLLTVESYEENEFVYSLAPGTDLWIGYNRLSSSSVWQWADGNKSPYTNWDKGQPDDQGGDQFCAHMWGWYKSFKWDDRLCTEEKKFVCKKQGEDFPILFACHGKQMFCLLSPMCLAVLWYHRP